MPVISAMQNCANWFLDGPAKSKRVVWMSGEDAIDAYGYKECVG